MFKHYLKACYLVDKQGKSAVKEISHTFQTDDLMLKILMSKFLSYDFCSLGCYDQAKVIAFRKQTHA